jgi:hypothetical protein
MFIYCKVLMKTPRKLLFTPCLLQDSNIILLITNAKWCQNSVYNLWYRLLVSSCAPSRLAVLGEKQGVGPGNCLQEQPQTDW